MSTFLELCKSVAQDSGTIPDLNAPATVTSQTGRLLRIVGWTRDAYKDIQRHREDWRWMQHEFTGSTVADVQAYLADAIGVTSRFASWTFRDEAGVAIASIYDPTESRATEGFLTDIPYEIFRRNYMYGAGVNERGKPIYVSVDPQDRLVLWPTPDKTYIVRGMYRKSPQILAADADIPEMPSSYHEAIKWRALILLGTFDEAMEQLPLWAASYREQIAALERTQTPRVRMGGPLA